MTVADSSGIAIGAPINGLPGVADGSVTVTSVVGSTVTLSANVNVPHGLPLQFGVVASPAIVVDDVMNVEVGDAVSGAGYLLERQL